MGVTINYYIRHKKISKSKELAKRRYGYRSLLSVGIQ